MRLITLLFLMICFARPLAAQADGFAPVAEAMRAEAWDAAYLLALAQGEVAHTLVTWTRLRDGAGSIAEYEAFLAAYPDWPGLERLRREGERAIPQGHDPAQVIAYFGDNLPQTGAGAVRLSEAHIARGAPDQAAAMLTQVWSNQGFDDADHDRLIAAYAPALASVHTERADAMLWRWRTSDAERLLDLLPPQERALAQARIALITGSGAAAALVAQVPDALRDDPGLANARFNAMAQAGDYTDAIALMTARSTSAEALGEPFRWASWRATLTRWTLRQGRAEQAYEIATAHFLSDDGRDASFYADLEWLAGYASLRLGNRARAKAHFEAMSAAVSSPISTSRASYWLGRAETDLGNDDAATAAYLDAAQHQTAFYGLVASDVLGLSLDPAIAGGEEFADWRDAAWVRGDLAVAATTLLDAGERGRAVLFISKLAQTLDRTGLGQLGDMLTARDEPWLTVLVGKTAVARGIVIPAHYFPLHPLAEMDLPVSDALALSIARRESEFNFTVGSPVGALGLMQLMPGTAREVAGELGLSYSRARLTADWPYNARLGSQYLANLTETFGDSPVMIAAGYNAGPSRPRTWMSQRGDPRRGDVDVIDWIESIPFTETRNYVMRVSESIPVYEARLSGRAGPVRFMDLLLGAAPSVRPQARP